MQTNRRLLFHTVSSLAALMMDDRLNCCTFHEEGGVEVLASLLRHVHLNKAVVGVLSPAKKQACSGEKRGAKQTGVPGKLLDVIAAAHAMKVVNPVPPKFGPETLLIDDREEEDQLPNSIIKSSISLFGRVLDVTDAKEYVGRSFAFRYLLAMVTGCSRPELGIVAPMVLESGSREVSPRGCASEAGASRSVNPHDPWASRSVSPHDPRASVFEIVGAAMQLLAKLCDGCESNRKALPRYEKFPKLTAYLTIIEGDARSMRLGLHVMALLDRIVPQAACEAAMPGRGTGAAVGTAGAGREGADGVARSLVRDPGSPHAPVYRLSEEGAAGPLPLPEQVSVEIITRCCEIVQYVDLPAKAPRSTAVRSLQVRARVRGLSVGPELPPPPNLPDFSDCMSHRPKECRGFFLRTAPRDHQPPPTANRQPPPTAINHQSPTTNRAPSATNW